MKQTIGFIFNFALSIGILSAQQSDVTNIVFHGDQSEYTINRHIYGHFSEHLGRCIYDGYWVDEDMAVPKHDRIRLDIVEALKKIKIPNLRWPGGCFADEYHWKDGIGPRNERPTMVNTNWGGVTEDNSFGTHEFLELCSLLETEPFIIGNVGSGTVEELSEWVEYVNFDGVSPMTNLRAENGREEPWKVSFWGIGNEAWGCGGDMSPDFYADLYKRYGSFTESYAGTRVNKIASGPSGSDTTWTSVFFQNLGGRRGRGLSRRVWGIDFHYYTRPPRGRFGPPGEGQPQQEQRRRGSATDFEEDEYFGVLANTLRMDELIRMHSEIMDRYDPQKSVALVVGEWGVWLSTEPGTNPRFLYQQNSLRDALLAGTTLNIFNNHCDRVKMAQLAQTVNVLQALILTKEEQMILTPTYHAFDLYKVHQDAKLLPVDFTSPDYTFGDESIPALNASASQDESGAIHITLVNLDPHNAIPVNTTLNGVEWKTVTGSILTSDNYTDVNTFENPEVVKTVNFTGARRQRGALTLEVPSKSIVMLELK
jgi:alpha-N-arabinofuranosidase